MDELKDIKPPIDLPHELLWLWIALSVAALALIAFFLWKQWGRMTQKSSVPALPPWEKALQDLAQLEGKEYPKQCLFKEYMDGLSDILRYYIEGRFGIKAPEMTTEEFLNHVRREDRLTDVQRRMFEDFLQLCDLVKFAKTIPTLDQTREAMVVVRRFVEETKGGTTDGV